MLLLILTKQLSTHFPPPKPEGTRDCMVFQSSSYIVRSVRYPRNTHFHGDTVDMLYVRAQHYEELARHAYP